MTCIWFLLSVLLHFKTECGEWWNILGSIAVLRLNALYFLDKQSLCNSFQTPLSHRIVYSSMYY